MFIENENENDPAAAAGFPKFAMEGDSGSLVFTVDPNNYEDAFAAGVLFAGSTKLDPSGRGAVCFIDAILQSQNLELVIDRRW